MFPMLSTHMLALKESARMISHLVALKCGLWQEYPNISFKVIHQHHYRCQDNVQFMWFHFNRNYWTIPLRLNQCHGHNPHFNATRCHNPQTSCARTALCCMDVQDMARDPNPHWFREIHQHHRRGDVIVHEITCHLQHHIQNLFKFLPSRLLDAKKYATITKQLCWELYCQWLVVENGFDNVKRSMCTSWLTKVTAFAPH